MSSQFAMGWQPGEAFLQQWRSAAERRLSEFNPQSLANTLRAVASFQWGPLSNIRITVVEKVVNTAPGKWVEVA